MSHWEVFNRAFAQAIKRVKLNKEITDINYHKDKVLVKTKDNEYFQADFIIITSCLKILQKEMVKFHPQLPPWKQKAINEIGIEPMGKLFLKFSEPVLPPNIAILYFDYHGVIGWVGSDERSKGKEYVLIFLIAEKVCTLVDSNE